MSKLTKFICTLVVFVAIPIVLFALGIGVIYFIDFITTPIPDEYLSFVLPLLALSPFIILTLAIFWEIAGNICDEIRAKLNK